MSAFDPVDWLSRWASAGGGWRVDGDRVSITSMMDRWEALRPLQEELSAVSGARELVRAAIRSRHKGWHEPSD